MRLAFLSVGSAVFALAACDVPPGAVAPISPEAAQAATPELIETARFDAALAKAEPDAERLGADRDALAARAAALRARAAGMGAPVVPPDERTRLEAGVTIPPAAPDAAPGAAEEP